MKYSVFKGKDRLDRYQGIVTKVGKKKFEEARVRLAQLVKQPIERISDGDTFEYLARGHKDSQKYVTAQVKVEAARQKQRAEKRRKRRAEARKLQHGARRAAEAAARPAPG